MTAKFDSMFASEPHKMSGATSTTPSSGGQKLSMFAAKSGFVIPKNKLLGSLVPIFRGAKKDGVTGVINEESSKQIERKSRWGPDPTQDASVRRAKVLALQVIPATLYNNSLLSFLFSYSIIISLKIFFTCVKITGLKLVK